MGRQELEHLLADVRRCTLCEDLPLGPSPLLQAGSTASVLLAGQAPGRITHQKGRPFDDASGRRLRDWLAVTEAEFYDPARFAILPMAFCFPGTGTSGDLPPPPVCAATWRESLLTRLPNIQLILLLGAYAQDWHLPDSRGHTVTEKVSAWRDHWPHTLCLPHPSPRNNRWLKNNPQFESAVLPVLKQRIRELIG